MEAENEWELAKENFQPLKQGREPDQMAEAAPTPERSVIERQKRQFWAEIENYEGPDPLDPWIRFVKWTQKTFVAGGRQAELLPLLESCTRKMREMPGYDNDIRYLRLWLQYADCLPQPQDVFAFLMDNKIGQNFALFYMAYAAFLELRGNFGKAEAIFERGLERMATPIHKLRAKYTDFQERMERRKLREAQEGVDSAANQAEPHRAALGVLKGKSKPSRSGTARPAQTATGVLAPRRQPSVGQRDKENSVAALDVFTDDRFKDGAAPSKPDFNLSGKGTSGGWQNLTGFQAARKENERLPSHGRGSKLKQNKHLMPATDPDLEIPEDEDLKEVKRNTPEAPKGTLRQRLDSSGTRPIEESLMNDPLRLIKRREGHQLPSGTVNSENDKTKGAKLPGGGGLPHNSKDPHNARDLRTFGAGRTGPLFAAKPPPVPDTRLLTGRLDREGADTCRMPEITLNTQAAFDSVNDMFKGALPKDCAWQSNEPSTTIRFGDATVTMSTKAAYDAINSMFGSSSLQETRPRGRPGSARAEDQDTQSGMFEIYEDTGFLDRPRTQKLGQNEDPSASFQPYEDTDFLPSKPRPQSASTEQTDDFSIYQDTEFLPGKLPEVHGRSKSRQSSLDHSRGGSGSGRASASRGKTEDTGSFFVYEDPDL